ncbi:Sir2 family transcription regulator [Clavulina sp. PMI_390]|nr:Sir2 family transcription regulator [Clavulina sp. PMI_390]
MSQAPTKVLESRDLKGIAKFLGAPKPDGSKKQVVVLAGAGISTSAGIPDFRSPGTGLYSNLARFNLPYPEAVFAIDFFESNPYPFYALAKELAPGLYRPTPTHSFIDLLSQKGHLLKCFTQNIDTLERRAGVPPEKIVEAHGSFATSSCIDCKKPFDDERMGRIIRGEENAGKGHKARMEIPKCDSCGGLVKPDIVFFGEGLPKNFFESLPLIPKADLVIIMGTSLMVQPFASLATMAAPEVPVLLLNLERVGGIGREPTDVVHLGPCDQGVRDLCELMGWESELEDLWALTALPSPSSPSLEEASKTKAERDAELEKELEKISEAIEASLRVSDEFAEETKAELDAEKPTETPATGEVGRSKEHEVYKDGEWDEYGHHLDKLTAKIGLKQDANSDVPDTSGVATPKPRSASSSAPSESREKDTDKLEKSNP